MPLGYDEALVRLAGLHGRFVDAVVRDAHGTAPTVVRFGGTLATRRLKSADPEERDALAILMGGVLVTMHPDHFEEASGSRDGDQLDMVLGGLRLTLRRLSSGG